MIDPSFAKSLRTARLLRRALTPLFLLLLLFAPGPAVSTLAVLDDAPRYAVVLGNQNYPSAPLANPVNDARAMASVLRELSFNVQLVEDVTLDEFNYLVENLPKVYPEGSVGIFFYAGHAVQLHGENYLLPIDMALKAADDLPEQSIAVSRILKTFEEAGVQLRIVVLDSCRDYPWGEFRDAFGSGLASIDASGETLIAYSTRAGATAFDGVGPNSPYTGALVSALELPGRDIYDVFKTVRYKVREATNGRQIPWVGGSIESSFVFNPVNTEEQTRAAPSSLVPAQVHWTSIEHSRDPTDFLHFIDVYRTGPLVTKAVLRLQALLEEQQQAVPPPDVQISTIAGTDIQVTRCDRWVADPYDPRRISAGIEWGLVNTRQAIRDCAEALQAAPDDPRLNFNFGRALDIAERFNEARYFYERADAADYGAAARNLGFMYRTGRGVEPDDRRAAEFYLKASMLGVLDARKALAKMYEEGWGVPQSFDETVRWIRLAAEDGYPNALDHLGNLYRTGQGVEKDESRAVDLYSRAAALGSGNGAANLARMYRDGLAVPADLPTAVQWYSRAIELGSPFAPYHLGRIYLKGGRGVARNPERARELLEMSVDMGREWALWQLGQSYYYGDFGEKDLQNALYYLMLAVEAGGALRNSAGTELKETASKRLAEVEAEASPEVIAAARKRAEEWVAQNSLYEFALIYPY